MPKNLVAVSRKAHAPFELVEREITAPAAGQVRI
jgi:hypothetical protein